MSGLDFDKFSLLTMFKVVFPIPSNDQRHVKLSTIHDS
jgi:hypothetical protein